MTMISLHLPGQVRTRSGGHIGITLVLAMGWVAACEDPLPPVACGALPRVTVNVGETMVVQACFNDPNEDMLSYAASSSNPSVATASISGASITVRAIAPGNASVTITATDPGGLAVHQSFPVLVPNRPPRPTGTMPALEVAAGTSATVNASSYFAEPDGQDLTFGATSSDTAVAAVSVAGDTVTVAAVAKGTADVTITATDAGGMTAIQTFQATVPNRGPLPLDTIATQTVEVGETVAVDASGHFDDPDGDALTYSATSSDTAVAAVSVAGDTVTISAVAKGGTEVTVTATDPGNLSATQTFQATVPNRGPVLVDTIAAQTVHTGEAIALVAARHFDDPDGDALTYSASSSDPAVAMVAVAGDTVKVSAVAPGATTVTLTATDTNGLTSAHTFPVLVPNRPPQPRGTIPTLEVAAEAATIDATAYFTDPDGENLTYSATSSSPAIATVSASTADGIVTVTAVAGGTTDVTVTAADPGGLTATQTFQATVLTVSLSVSAIYLNQAIQDVEGGVPLIAGRDALLRVFVIGDEPTSYQPKVRATFHHRGTTVYEALMSLESDTLPTRIREDRLDRSFNSLIPGEIIRPGLGLVVDIDAEGVVPLKTGSEIRVPAQGVMDLDVIDVPTHVQTIVPVLVSSAPDERILDWTRGIDADNPHMALARSLLPIGDLDVRLHKPFYTSEDLTTAEGWGAFLNAMRVLWHMEGEIGYYYGAVALPRESFYVGIASVGLPISVGDIGAFAHELGHNMNLRHAPCGGAPRPDRGYPYKDGGIGQWGYDIDGRRLLSPEEHADLMGYCGPQWISDYHFKKALSHRRATEQFDRSSAVTQAPSETTLLLWGGVVNEKLLLEPAFLVQGTPRLPKPKWGGAYRLEGYRPDGVTHFSFSFTPDPVDHGGRQFLFAVPYDHVHDGPLDRVVLSGPEGEVALGPGSARPMAIITDRATGQVRGILRDWIGGFNLVSADVEIMVSDGLPGGIR